MLPDVTGIETIAQFVARQHAGNSTCGSVLALPPVERHPIITEDLRRILAAPLPWDRLQGRTILVTGAAGFLPAYMVETILALNEHVGGPAAHVVALVRNEARARARFAVYAGRDDLEIVTQDVVAPLRSERRLDFVIHAASQASPVFYDTDPVGTIDANVLGTRQVLERARADRSEGILFFSSGEVYGDVNHFPTREDQFGSLDPTNVRACYGESKRMGENMCACWHHQHGVHATIVRPYHTYGPGVRLDDGRVFADFVADVLAQRPIAMKSAGTAIRAFCYLADATEGFFTVLLRGVPGLAYNVGNDEAELSILELARTLGDEFGLDVVEQAREPGSVYVPSPHSRGAPETERIRALGWSPRTGVREGFRRTVASFR